MTLFIPIVALSLVAFLSAVLCWGLIKVAPKDAPDAARKTQAQAVPTSGGIAIAAAIILSVCLILYLDRQTGSVRSHFAGLPFESLLPYTVLSLGVLIIGAVDDAKPIRAKPKLLGIGLATLIAATISPVFGTVFLPGADSIMPLPAGIAICGTALWIFVLMNAANFMDGSNGLAMGVLAIMIGALSLRFLGLAPYGAALFVFGAVVVAAIIGFLFWNLRGRLYAGDAGSLFGGAVFATLSLFAAQDGNIWFPATLALPILVDVFMTLIWRARRGHNILTPHRHHAYQLVVKSGSGHMKTALIWWSFAGLCAWAALWAAGLSKSASAGTFAILLAAGCAAWLVHRARTPAEFH